MTPETMILNGVRALESAYEGQLTHTAAAAVATAWAALAASAHTVGAGADAQPSDGCLDGCDAHRAVHEPGCDCGLCMDATHTAITNDRKNRP